MKAVIATKYGSPDVLQIRDVEKPTPKANEILVKIHATTVTPGDCRMRSFNVPPMFWLPGRLALGITKPKHPVFGSELSGEVEAVGQAVTRFRVGDAIFAYTTHDLGSGAHAEYKCVPEDACVTRKPDSLSYEEAAAIPFGGLTALNFLRRAHIEPGQSVLVNGASGAVGTYAVQLAKYYGAEVTAVCSARNRQMVKSLGADRVIDYTSEDFTRNGEVYDVIFDTVGTTTFSQCKNSLKQHGYYLHAVMVAAGLKTPWYAMTTGRHVVGGTPTGEPDGLDFLKGLIEAGAIKVVIDRCYPLEEIAEAHRYVDTGRKRGGVVISVIPGA